MRHGFEPQPRPHAHANVERFFLPSAGKKQNDEKQRAFYEPGLRCLEENSGTLMRLNSRKRATESPHSLIIVARATVKRSSFPNDVDSRRA
jgi:hypothetical protein